MALIQLSETTGRFDSVVEANRQDDPHVLKAAIEANLELLTGIVRHCYRVAARYQGQIQGLTDDRLNLMITHYPEYTIPDEQDSPDECE